jgi:unsaturated rhamnogalacturonyl hydrolase
MDGLKQSKWQANARKRDISQFFWSRSIGWYAMALVDVLDWPKNTQNKKKFQDLGKILCESLVKFQDKSGLWYPGY